MSSITYENTKKFHISYNPWYEDIIYHVAFLLIVLLLSSERKNIVKSE